MSSSYVVIAVGGLQQDGHSQRSWLDFVDPATAAVSKANFCGYGVVRGVKLVRRRRGLTLDPVGNPDARKPLPTSPPQPTWPLTLPSPPLALAAV